MEQMNIINQSDGDVMCYSKELWGDSKKCLPLNEVTRNVVRSAYKACLTFGKIIRIVMFVEQSKIEYVFTPTNENKNTYGFKFQIFKDDILVHTQ